MTKLPNISYSGLSDRTRTYLRSRGVPWHFFTRSFNPNQLIARFQYESNGKPRLITADIQIKALARTLAKPLERPYILIIGTTQQELTAGAVALAVFEKVVSLYLAKKVAAPPLWYPVYGGFEDKLRDNESYKATYGNMSMLVLSNVATNSTNSKIEKVRDLLTIYSDIPRIITVAGVNPIEFCQKTLYIRPDRVVYLAEKRIDL